MLALALVLTGCSVPADPDGTMDRIQGDTLRAGASLEDGLVEAADGTVTGPLAELVEEFAHRHDADVDWTTGSEESLVTALEERRLDIVVGGITADTPWVDRVGATRGYPEIAEGRELVLLVPPGENRLLFELEQFLDGELTR